VRVIIVMYPGVNGSEIIHYSAGLEGCI